MNGANIAPGSIRMAPGRGCLLIDGSIFNTMPCHIHAIQPYYYSIK